MARPSALLAIVLVAFLATTAAAAPHNGEAHDTPALSNVATARPSAATRATRTMTRTAGATGTRTRTAWATATHPALHGGAGKPHPAGGEHVDVQAAADQLAAAALVYTGDRLYMFGGMAPGSVPASSVLSLDLSRAFDANSALPVAHHHALPRGLAGAVPVLRGSTVALVGGYTAGANGTLARNTRVVTYDLAKGKDVASDVAETQMLVREHSLSHARYEHSGMPAFIFGGVNATEHAFVKDVTRVAIDAHGPVNVTRVVTGQTGPEPRSLASVVRVNATHVLVSGGARDGVQLRDQWLLAAGSGKWTRVADLAHARFNHRSLKYGAGDRYIVHVGGYHASAAANGQAYLLEVLDLLTGTVQLVTDVQGPTPNAALAQGAVAPQAFIVGDQLLVAGGYQWPSTGAKDKYAHPVAVIGIEKGSDEKLKFAWRSVYAPYVPADRRAKHSGAWSSLFEHHAAATRTMTAAAAAAAHRTHAADDVNAWEPYEAPVHAGHGNNGYWGGNDMVHDHSETTAVSVVPTETVVAASAASAANTTGTETTTASSLPLVAIGVAAAVVAGVVAALVQRRRRQGHKRVAQTDAEQVADDAFEVAEVRRTQGMALMGW
ncbi:hypothetical protein H9P43_006436 [Blastocladiella emersonii ATCC 22665]|nr:hypothetical protein H9P43_006436 [Blastocladiella emersonii ATCC 22665]